MDNNLMQEEFNAIYNFDNDDETIYDSDFDDLLEMIEDGTEQDAASPFEAE
jgi:hypothetical protein